MATLKPTVKTKLKTGMYIVYIRVVQNRQSSFIRTSWMVNDKGVKGKEVTDPFVMQQVSNLISSYYSMLNKIDSSSWTASEVVAYLTTSTEDMSFSDYARNHIEKLIRRGQERTSRNYKWALNHMERFAETDNIMFSRMTSAFLNRWIASLSETNRCKEQYPVCIREVYKAALKEFNDEEQGIIRDLFLKDEILEETNNENNKKEKEEFDVKDSDFDNFPDDYNPEEIIEKENKKNQIEINGVIMDGDEKPDLSGINNFKEKRTSMQIEEENNNKEINEELKPESLNNKIILEK